MIAVAGIVFGALKVPPGTETKSRAKTVTANGAKVKA